MSRTFDYAPNGSYAFDWNAQPKLNDPIYESPVPCRAGYNCCYTGVCSFVHPGEEGLGRRIFPARAEGEKDVVRIFGQPHKKATFYERRRLRLSWPEWCRRNGLPAPVPQAKVASVVAPSHKRKQVIDLAEPKPVEAAYDPVAAYQQWYQAQAKAQQEAFMAAAHHCAQTQQDFGLANWAAYEQILYANGAFVSMSFRQSYGELLFGKVAQALEENRAEMREVGWLTEKTTAGKIVGMFLDAYTDEELGDLYANQSTLVDAIVDACEMLVDAAAKAAAPKAPSAKSVAPSATLTAPVTIEGAWGDISADA
jgi:hypothetical protein